MLTYRRSDSLEIEGYSDSDFVGDIDDRKSTSGYVHITASSTMYAKFVACYEASGQVK